MNEHKQAIHDRAVLREVHFKRSRKKSGESSIKEASGACGSSDSLGYKSDSCNSK
jgi:hypothetical protein